MMLSQATNQGKLYRQFSRSRFSQIQRQRPTMRQSEIIQKIIREWQSMPISQRNKWANMAAEEVIETPMKMMQEMKKVKENMRSTEDKKDSTVKKMEDEENEEMMNNKDKTKMIKKNKKALFKNDKNMQKQPQMGKQADYINFYKMQYRMLMSEHPNWSVSQVSVIIKLRWKQFKMRVMGSKQRLQQKPSRVMKLSGRMQFKMLKKPMGYTDMEIMSRWKKFPFQTKMLWQNRQSLPKSRSIKMCTVILPENKEEMAMKKAEGLFQLMHSQ